MSEIERKMKLLNRGNLATIAYEKFALEAEETKTALLSRAKAEYRSGKVEHDALIGLLAAHCAIDDLLNRLKTQITTANSMHKKEKENNVGTD